MAMGRAAANLEIPRLPAERALAADAATGRKVVMDWGEDHAEN
jgi:hypothetical protein